MSTPLWSAILTLWLSLVLRRLKRFLYAVWEEPT